MPQYTYQCQCGNVFTVIISMARAMCKRSYPNHKFAKCPECGEFADRLFPEPDYIVYTKIYDLDKILRQIKAKPDPTMDGMNFVNAGHPAPTVNLNLDQRDDDNKFEFGIRNDIACDCEYCNPVINEEGIKMQKEKDKQLADLLKRNHNIINPQQSDQMIFQNKVNKIQQALNTVSPYITIGKDGVEGR